MRLNRGEYNELVGWTQDAVTECLRTAMDKLIIDPEEKAQFVCDALLPMAKRHCMSISVELPYEYSHLLRKARKVFKE